MMYECYIALSIQEVVLKLGSVSTTSLTGASLAATVNFYTVPRKSWPTRWPTTMIQLWSETVRSDLVVVLVPTALPEGPGSMIIHLLRDVRTLIQLER